MLDKLDYEEKDNQIVKNNKRTNP